jgi:hypothetical protein
MRAIPLNNRIGFILVLLAFYGASCKKEPSIYTKPKPEITLNANDSRLQSPVIHLYKDTVYVLAANITRNAGEKLVLDAGTLVKVNDKFSITIFPGGEIASNGTAAEPVVFTSAAPAGGAGAGGGGATGSRFWYGIRIYGNALTQPTTGSGKITFTRIEFAGGNENGSGLPSLLLQDVTSQTVLENIQVSYSFNTPSFEFNGGNCNAANLVSYASGSSDFYIHNAYNGMLQFLLAWRHPYFPAGAGFVPARSLTGLLIEDSTSLPLISNITVLGPGLSKETNISYLDTISKGLFGTINGRRVAAFVATADAKFQVRNSAFLAFPKGGFHLDNKITALSLYNGESGFSYSLVHSYDTTRAFYLWPDAFPPFTSRDFKELMLQPQFGNQVLPGTNAFMLINPFEYDINPDPMPNTSSPLLSGASFNGVFANAFFNKVAWRGAFGSSNWLSGWTNFKPLQTGYNN